MRTPWPPVAMTAAYGDPWVRLSFTMIPAFAQGWVLWTVLPVVPVSALAGTGIDEAWAEVERFQRHLRETGDLDRLRAQQAVEWMWAEMRERLVEELRADERVAARLADVERAVRAGTVSPTTAAHELLAAHGLADGDDCEA